MKTYNEIESPINEMIWDKLQLIGDEVNKFLDNQPELDDQTKAAIRCLASAILVNNVLQLNGEILDETNETYCKNTEFTLWMKDILSRKIKFTPVDFLESLNA